MTTETTIEPKRSPKTKKAYPPVDAQPIGDPDAAGRVRVQLPDLPLSPEFYVRNTTRVGRIIPPNKGDTVADLVIKGLEEKELPDANYWLMHSRFRQLITDQEDEEGNLIPAPVEVYKRTEGYKKPRMVPEKIRCEQKYFASVEDICSAPMEQALEHINIDAETEAGRRDAKWMVDKWFPVLRHSKWRLEDMRRCGHEVEQERLDALDQRMDEISEIRRKSGMKASTY